jgi:hypothetical protein
MDIVTVANPNVRQHCHLRELTTDTITCKAARHHAEAVFNRLDVLAFIAPPSHANLIGFLEVGAIVGAVLAASFFVPFGWAITIRVVAGFLFYGGWAGVGDIADHSMSDHNHDILLYQRPNTLLTIHLRAH